MADLKKKKKKKKSLIIFIVELIVLLVLVVGIFVLARINEGLNAIGTGVGSGNGTTGAVDEDGNPVTYTDVSEDPNADADAAEENEEVSKNKTLKGYTNIALVGIDTRDVNQIDYANSDTMIIASINNETGAIRMVSLYRDTILNIGTRESTTSQGDSDEEEVVEETVNEASASEEPSSAAEEDFGDAEEPVSFEESSGGDDGGDAEEPAAVDEDTGSSDDTGTSEEPVSQDDGGSDTQEEAPSELGNDDSANQESAVEEIQESTSATESSSREEPESAAPITDTTESAANRDTDAVPETTESSEDSSEKPAEIDSTEEKPESESSSSESKAESESDGPAEYSYSHDNEYYNYDEEGTQTGETTAAGRYDKANAAYANGSAKQLLTMLNKNLDLNIHDYVVVDFSAVAKLVDDLGGIDVWMTDQEVIHMNNYCVETSKVTGLDYTPIEPQVMPQDYHLNGVQAVSYARIRYTAGWDMKRTQRQRVVIEKVVAKAKEGGLTTINALIEDVFPLCKTSFSNAEIMKMATQMFGYDIDKTSGFPFAHLEKNVYVGSRKLDAIIPVTLEQNVQELHEFLFDEKDYECSATVKEYSNDIVSLSGLSEKSRDVAEKNSVIAKSGGEADVVK